jgi:pyruvate, orthophosphate dikinase
MHEFLPTAQALEADIDALKHYLVVVKGQRTTLATLNLSIALPSPFEKLTEEAINTAIEKKQLMLKKVNELFEVNPMLGHRGVRLGISYPEIYRMQTRAILEAAAMCIEAGMAVKPEIMVPQVITVEELRRVKAIVLEEQQAVELDYQIKLKCKLGTMVETVRACLRAEHLAEEAEFFSFGTNDLTQATFSFSREDAENKFLPLYNETRILQDNPFEVLDVKGVGQLMKMSVQQGRKNHPHLQVGICGEQGGHPYSIRFCHHIKLNYVSCSAPRIPIARLAAAHAKLLENEFVE